MTPYEEPSLVKSLYEERLARAEAERLASRVSRKHQQPARRARETRGVNGLLAWYEGMAIIRRVA